MGETSIFGLDPDQLDQLFSLGTGRDDEAGHEAGKPKSAQPAEESRAADSSSFTASLESSLDQVGQCIGPYRLVSVLGEGGMGMVYLAEQEGAIKRQVALKVVKPGMDSRRVIARFEAERQALALLDHPNIAHVYDAGTTESGRPYFVMEHVKGLPITEYCDRHRLRIEDRLRLFQQVCLAVHHAHQKGIIHRDLKPSNILVSAEDDRPTPKIIDFGVAKAISQPLTERTLFTEDSHLLGTPEYMSPEQAEMASEDIDTRSDIYSLGVLLYVLLAGILPYDSKTFRQGGIEGIRKIIRETDPKTPSTRLTKLGEEAKKLAESRRSEITALARCLRKELEWIPLKAMRKDRAERYRSASELADDVENYLRGAPLIAGPPGTGYRLKKFVRRNCVSVGGIAAVIVVLVAGVVVSTIFAIGQARALAENQLITDFLENDVLGSADEAKVNEATVGYVLDAASKDLGKFNDKPLIQARLCKTLGGIYRNLGEYEKADQHISRAIEIYRQYRGEAHPDTLAAMSLIGWVYIKQGRYHDMERLYTKLLQIRQHVYGVEHPIGVMHGLAVAYYYLGKYQEAESLFEEMLQTYQNETPFLVHIKANLAIVYTLQGRYEKAEPLFVETLGVDWLGDPYTAELANMYREQGRYDKAEPLLVTALETQRQRRGDEHFHTVSCMDCFVRLYVDQDRYEEAETLFNEALPIARHRMRPDHPVTLRLVNARAVLHAKQKQYDQAEKLFNEALDGRQRELGDDHPDTLETMNDIGVLRRAQQRYEEAESLLRQALDGRQRKLGPDHPACFESMHELAVLYLRQARYEEAEPLLLDTFHGRETKLGPEHPDTLDSLKELVNLYEALSKPDEAAKWRAKLPGPDTTGEQ